MDAGTLHTAIADVCPVISTRVGVADDRSTWSFDPGAGATQPQIDAGNNVIATIPVSAVQDATTNYSNAVSAGIIMTWTSSTGLNGIYALDVASQAKLNSIWTVVLANATFPNGTALQSWHTMSGTSVSMSSPQFKAFCSALFKYVSALDTVRASQAGGGNPTWPSNAVSVTG